MHHSGVGNTVEKGYCSIHRKQRKKPDLIPLEGGRPGELRCNPQKECRFDERVQCHLHSRYRVIHDMNEVRKGVWECKKEKPCHVPGSAEHRAARHQVFSPSNNEFFASPARPQGHANHPHHRSGEGVQHRDYQASRPVRCAYHGKQLNFAQYQEIEDCCFVCRDPTACLSTPLEPPSVLQSQGCEELLCSRHNTLRAVEFLELEEHSYRCTKAHPCRHTTIAQTTSLYGDGIPLEDTTTGQTYYDGAEQYGQWSSHGGAVSSFLM